jgi:hypothetical protein
MTSKESSPQCRDVKVRTSKKKKNRKNGSEGTKKEE